MKALKLITINLFILVGIAMFSNCSWAFCKFTTPQGTANNTMPILKNQITVGRDVPVGTVIYRQMFDTSTASEIWCEGTGTLTTKRHLNNNTKIKANWTGSPFPNAVYESGIPGIGFAYDWRSLALPNESTIPYNTQPFVYTGMLDFTINFIKIGPVSPGSINLATLPSATLDAIWSGGSLRIDNLNFSGSLQVVSQTCKTPDVTVNLGPNSLEPLVAGTKTETARKSFNVILTNCPAFYGMGDPVASPAWIPQKGTVRYNEVNNNVKISFTPKNGVLDSNAMIAKLDTVQPGNAPAAQGIGIALYHSGGTRYKFDGSFVALKTPAIGSSSDITYPLEVSYTFDSSKPKSAMKPGSGSSAIEFTIQYN